MFEKLSSIFGYFILELSLYISFAKFAVYLLFTKTSSYLINFLSRFLSLGVIALNILILYHVIF
ncbi:MAG: hypothetical protein BWY04_00262 [candidate division CPR1 bacterium ADurb.Bin160]|uniref:Uncharacterized protein n=1 Tax=candidate division CPR1 bacterium ADurb.Bin160 TaxID=1852826 RepID=A0A1V5ZQ54_9BACT|nr:MAG: hypothetical protein BWY04_00262 [candidate division CPR1 bacterium ADurb.Bin160]